ncbi:MAG: 23S rRNA (adenine(2503)-C(2))-methyltransferase RlmN [Lachnospiraceae bacterium]|jgi:23S rRNA (adenine2503-C2)-methyltransferase|nr:23S rRNA (adenine(2503)-C(2))-methyltransferase RlmN [Lachnospiraceae bacterium]
MEKREIGIFTLPELNKELKAWNEPRFRTEQIYRWIHEKLVESFSQMTNLPFPIRERLENSYSLKYPEIVEMHESEKDGTQKYLFSLNDGELIESVRIPQDFGDSVCVSSQVGCAMNCAFCASGIDGKIRNLSAFEMLAQVYAIQKSCGQRVSNVVVMGMGEPLDNYDNLVKFVRILSGEGGLKISRRNITVSTCGVVPGIRKLCEEITGITLALSLHAATQELRETLMPVAKTWPLDEVMEACEEYFKKTGRRVTYEYALIKNVNDRDEDIEALAKLLEGQNCHVNLIPVNKVSGKAFSKVNKLKATEVKNKLEKSGINVTIRKERGSDIGGACGQLRRHKAAL